MARARLPSAGAGVRPLRARLRRAADHRARRRASARCRSASGSAPASRDETDAKAGVTHFIEHLLFKGTRSYSAQRDRGDLRRAGRRAERGHVAREHRRLRAHPRPPSRDGDRRDGRHGLLADASPTSTTEREVVLEEIAMVEDTPQDLVHDLLAEAIFGGHPLGPPGDRARRRDLVGRAGARSRPTTGRCTRPGTSCSPPPATSTTTSCSRCSSAPAHQRVEPPEARTHVRKPLVKPPPPGLRFQRKETEQYHVCVGATGISRSDRRRFAASLLDAILGGSASSRLFQEIREKRGMAYSVYTFASQYSDTGQVGVYVGTREENLDAVLRDRRRADRRHRRRQRHRARSSSGRRRTSRAASCSRWSRRRTG